MYAFTINKKAYSIPEKAAELSLGQLIELQNPNNNELEILRILLGETITVTCANDKEEKEIQRTLRGVYTLVELLKEDIDIVVSSGLLLAAPKTINVLGVELKLNDAFVRSLPYWGYVHTKQAIQQRVKLGKDEKFDATDLIPGILSHNLYSLITKSPYNEAKAEEFIDVINDLNFIEAIQLGNFFLLQQKSLWVSRGKRWRILLNKMRATLALRYLKGMERLMSSKRYREVTFLSGKLLRD